MSDDEYNAKLSIYMDDIEVLLACLTASIAGLHASWEREKREIEREQMENEQWAVTLS